MSARSNKRRIYRRFYGRLQPELCLRSTEEDAWLNVVPVGREFGSADYHRFEQLDGYAFDVFGDMALAQQWLSRPHPALDGKTLNDCASNDQYLQKALELLAELKRNVVMTSVSKQMPADGNHTSNHSQTVAR
jgi:Protein of unknown function (DUF2384)